MFAGKVVCWEGCDSKRTYPLPQLPLCSAAEPHKSRAKGTSTVPPSKVGPFRLEFPWPGGSVHAAGSTVMCCRQRERQTGRFRQVMFLFGRKTIISKNALKLSSKTLSSSTERSECTGNFF